MKDVCNPNSCWQNIDDAIIVGYMKQVYLVPNIVTAFGLSCGLYVIFKTNLVGEGMDLFTILHSASLLLLLAALADFLDGAIARALHAESEFGFIFDSMSDGVTFGVAPSVLLLRALSPEHGSLLSFFIVSGAMLYSICGVLRLVRFNVKAGEMKENEEAKKEAKKSFTGLPIPSAAISAVSLNLFLHSPLGQRWLGFSETTTALILTSLTILVGFLMVSKFKFPSLKSLHIRVPSLPLLIATVVGAIFILYGILYRFPLALFAVFWGYIVVSLILGLVRKIVGRKAKVLEAFDPDSDDPF